MAAKKVEALEEKLESEVMAIKTSIEERFATVQQQFAQQNSSLEAILGKLTELQFRSPSNPDQLVGGHGRSAGDTAGEGSQGSRSGSEQAARGKQAVDGAVEGASVDGQVREEFSSAAVGVSRKGSIRTRGKRCETRANRQLCGRNRCEW